MRQGRCSPYRQDPIDFYSIFPSPRIGKGVMPKVDILQTKTNIVGEVPMQINHSIRRFAALLTRGGLLRVVGSAIVLYFCAVLTALSATITINSTDFANVQTVQSIINSSASDGDIVKFPAASVTWLQELSVSKAISSRGAGIGQTVITAGFTSGSGVMIFYDPGTAQLPKTFELSGITFDANYTCSCFRAGAVPNVGPSTGLKIHHNRFVNGFSYGILLYGWQFGVFYQNEFQDNYVGIFVGGVNSAGWNYAYSHGGPNYPFFEDNTFTETVVRAGLIAETGQGGRIVFRHNTITGYGGSVVINNQTYIDQVWDAHGVG